jgi:Endosomal/lysosomal potassium channel TMEM175
VTGSPLRSHRYEPAAAVGPLADRPWSNRRPTSIALSGAAAVASVIRWMRWPSMARAPRGRPGADTPSVYRDSRRLAGFSDAVFAITITLLALEIRPPTDDSNLLHGLVALWPSYLAYAVTFLFIGQVWATTTSCSTTSVQPTGPSCS